eukprot:985951-Lingulodinium_polyedra.AAC.1
MSTQWPFNGSAAAVRRPLYVHLLATQQSCKATRWPRVGGAVAVQLPSMTVQWQLDGNARAAT